MAFDMNEHTKLSTWLDEEGQLYEHSGQAPAPSKDFCQVIVTPTQVIFRWWKISHRQSEVQRLHPGEIKECHEDFLHDEGTQTKIMCAFGQPMVDYIVNLCQGHIDYLERLPKKALYNILHFLDLEDIAVVSTLNKKFHATCDDDQLWQMLFEKASNVTDEIQALAREQGWKKLFFSNKLQIQIQLKRKRKT